MISSDVWSYRQGVFHCEDVSLEELAIRHGTPAYVYSSASIRRACVGFLDMFSPLNPQVNFAVKANPSIAVLKLIAESGLGFDIVSLGELHRVELAGGDLAKVVFSGVGKGVEEMEVALEKSIQLLCVESASELEKILQVGKAHGVDVPLSIRVNPDIDPDTHPYIATGIRSSKFGVPVEEALTLSRRIADSDVGSLKGISCHIGSQIFDVNALREAAVETADLAQHLMSEGFPIHTVDLGGGFGINYENEDGGVDLESCFKAYRDVLSGRDGLQLMLEPGRILTARSGVLLTRVRYVKDNLDRKFAVVDAAMNDLLRPALYGARHRISPILEDRLSKGKGYSVDVVGPVCESADFLSKECEVDARTEDVLAVRDVGAYGMAMASNYNERPRPCEIMVSGSGSQVVRRRETYEDLVRAETGLG